MIDTKEYRCKEFEKLAGYSQYHAKIKIVKENGMTKWMNIEKSELQEIMQILTK